MIRTVVACFALVMVSFFSAAQSIKQTENVGQVWLGYYNQTRFSDQWGMWTDLHLRTRENMVDQFSQSILRFGITRYLGDATRLTAGYAYVSIYPAEGHRQVTQPEHRPWQQLQWYTKYGRKRMMQWLRLEERYRKKIRNDSTLAEGYNFNYRLRYNIFYELPLAKKPSASGLSFVLNDEVHINFGKQVVNNYFDQNRFFAGFKYQLNEANNVQFGYMNLFQQLPAGNRYRSLHTLRVFYFQNLDLRKKAPNPPA